MGRDVSSEVAGMISGSKVYGSSDNIRHGKYKFLIKRIHAEEVEVDEGKHRMGFWEVIPLTSEPNPVFEGDRVDYVSPQQPGTGPLKDDGTKPNAVGSNCAMKVDFDGAGSRSAGANIKAAILALFNKYDGEIPDSEVDKTWVDLARRKPCKAGDIIGFDAATNQPVKADKDKQANPACGMIINCVTSVKKKKKPNDKGMYITKLNWSCAAPIGTGENAPDQVAKRRAELELKMAEDDDEEDTSSGRSGNAPQAPPPANGQSANGQAAAPPPPAPPAPPAPPPPVAVFTPPAPWVKHPTAPWGSTPDQQWYHSDPTKGGDNSVRNVLQLRAGQ